MPTHLPITPRQRAVLLMLCDGLRTKDIAREFRISIKTVEFHRKSLMERTGSRSLAHLIRYAVRSGLIKP